MFFTARIFVFGIALVLSLGLMPVSAQAQSSSVANPQGGQEYPACCSHCSEVTCSGCYSDITACTGDLPYTANCTTNYDDTVCKPKSAAIQLLQSRQKKSNQR